jgi:ATP-binding cassette subfamily F protein uup
MPTVPTIVRDLSTVVSRGDRIGIVGSQRCRQDDAHSSPAGELAPIEGKVRLGTKLEIGYFDQLHAGLEERKSVQENLTGTDTTGDRRALAARDRLPRRLPVHPGSGPLAGGTSVGGERNRLLLAKLFSRPANLLVLDEPTNDLDAETLDLLEELLAEFSGTVLMVSHDREFLNRTVTSLLVFEGDGVVKEYAGGYDDYVRVSGRTAPPPDRPPRDRRGTRQSPLPWCSPRRLPTSVAKGRKLSAKEVMELDAFPGRIEKLEIEQRAIEAKMAAPGFYQSAPAEITKAATRLEAIGHEIEACFARWSELDQFRR